jgi:hypothetical protein
MSADHGRNHTDLRLATFGDSESDPLRGYYCVDVWAGRKSGEHATSRKRHVQVMVSPTGRSVQVYVDGKKVPS